MASSTPEVIKAPPTVEQLILEAFPGDPVMLRIAKAESRLDPKAKNPKSSASGVFQILSGTFKAYGCKGDVFDAADNIRCAKRIYLADGTTPWNSSKGAWK